MYSAEVSGMEEVEEEEMSKFEDALADGQVGRQTDESAHRCSVRAGLGGLAFLIFFYLPVLLFNVLNKQFDGTLRHPGPGYH